MKRVKTTILVVILMILSTVAIGIAAESVITKNQEKNINNQVNQRSFFDAEIKFTVVVDDGCGCNPIEGAIIKAYGGSGYNEGVTDKNGTVIFYLEINAEYRVEIESENYLKILFDFDIIDDQYFVFQMIKKEKSSLSDTLIQYLVNRLLVS